MRILLKTKGRIKSWMDGFYHSRTRGDLGVVDKVGPGLALRHDLDLMDENQINSLMRVEEDLGVRSTCFVLEDQLKRCAGAVRSLQSGGWDVQLHSEARPRFFTTFTFSNPKYGTLLTQSGYARKLRRQKRRFVRAGFPVLGHAPHGIHCCLDLSNESTWDVIERASRAAGFSWMAGYRSVFEVRGSAPFPEPIPPYRYKGGPGQDLTVYPVSWDDRFFFPSWEDRLMGRPPQTEAEGLISLDHTMERCESLGFPCVISLHPIWWFHRWDSRGMLPGPTYTHKLEKSAVEWHRSRGLPVRTISEMHQHVLSLGEPQ